MLSVYRHNITLHKIRPQSTIKIDPEDAKNFFLSSLSGLKGSKVRKCSFRKRFDIIFIES
jgi:hypothetical protein